MMALPRQWVALLRTVSTVAPPTPGSDDTSTGCDTGAMGGAGATYQILLVAHVGCAIVGFGSMALTGGYARLAGREEARGGPPRAARPGPPRAARRYFRPGPNLASRLVLVVPVLGLGLVGLDPGADLGQAWVWLGLALWALAAALAVTVLWPAEARIQDLLALPVAGGPTAPPGLPGPGALAQASRRASMSAAAIDLAFVAALVIMVAQPRG